MPTDAEIWEWIIKAVDRGVEVLGPHAIKILLAMLIAMAVITNLTAKGGPRL